MDTPSPDQVRARSELLAELYPAAGDPQSATDLTVHIEDAAELVSSLTGRLIAPATEGEEVPDGLLRTAARAVTMKTEQLVLLKASKERRKLIRARGLRSISAGPWSEAYFGPEEASKAKLLDPDPLLHEALWALATEDKREEWLMLWGGRPKPAGSITAFDHRRLPGGYGIDVERH